MSLDKFLYRKQSNMIYYISCLLINIDKILIYQEFCKLGHIKSSKVFSLLQKIQKKISLLHGIANFLPYFRKNC